MIHRSPRGSLVETLAAFPAEFTAANLLLWKSTPGAGLVLPFFLSFSPQTGKEQADAEGDRQRRTNEERGRSRRGSEKEDAEKASS